LDDDFYNGRTWEVGLKRFLPDRNDDPIELRILPLRHDLPIYLESKAWEGVPSEDPVARVQRIELLPEDEVVLHLPENRVGQLRSPVASGDAAWKGLN
jgi:hypothetical protein